MHAQDLIIVTSPPASGKTYWISVLAHSLSSVLVISPLRALADECRRMWGEKIVVMTPEEWLGKKVMKDVVIFDEFHLFFYWGDTFRPLMWEVFFELSLHANLAVLLTATFSEVMRKEVELFSVHFSSINWIDCGNQRLKFGPQKYIKLPSKSWIRDLVLQTEKGSGVHLVFCEFRQEVLKWEEELKKKGFTCVSCIGGESKHMAKKLERLPRPDFIVATTVLSHGVNLPPISEIFFTYKIKNIDFWIQMTARGGRRGDPYVVYALEKPYTLEWKPVGNFFQLVKLQLKIFFKSFDFF